MPEDLPAPIGLTLQQITDDALRPLFGENLPAFYAEQERHQAEARELIERATRVTRKLVSDALDRLTFFGGDRLALLPEAERNTAARRADVDRELHEALLEVRERHERRVKALRVDEEPEEQ